MSDPLRRLQEAILRDGFTAACRPDESERAERSRQWLAEREAKREEIARAYDRPNTSEVARLEGRIDLREAELNRLETLVLALTAQVEELSRDVAALKAVERGRWTEMHQPHDAAKRMQERGPDGCYPRRLGDSDPF